MACGDEHAAFITSKILVIKILKRAISYIQWGVICMVSWGLMTKMLK